MLICRPLILLLIYGSLIFQELQPRRVSCPSKASHTPALPAPALPAPALPAPCTGTDVARCARPRPVSAQDHAVRVRPVSEDGGPGGRRRRLLMQATTEGGALPRKHFYSFRISNTPRLSMQATTEGVRLREGGRP